MIGALFDSLAESFTNRTHGPSSVTISIPKDHPQADVLLSLARKLATKKVSSSGLEYRSAVVNPDARVKDFVAACADVCNELGVEIPDFSGRRQTTKRLIDSFREALCERSIPADLKNHYRDLSESQ